MLTFLPNNIRNKKIIVFRWHFKWFYRVTNSSFLFQRETTSSPSPSQSRRKSRQKEFIEINLQRMSLIIYIFMTKINSIPIIFSTCEHSQFSQIAQDKVIHVFSFVRGLGQKFRFRNEIPSGKILIVD